MTAKELIEGITSSYIEELFHGDDLTNMKTQGELNDCRMVCTSLLEYILEKYDIVDKENVRETIGNIRDAYDNGDNDMVDVYLGELESLFSITPKSEEL